jgi:L-asparaginase
MIRILLCGGTFDKIYDPLSQTMTLQDRSAVPLILENGFATGVEVERVLRKDSLDMTEEDRLILVKRIELTVNEKSTAGIVVVHGTDSLVQSALAVDRLSTDIPIVFTGALVPHSLRQTDTSFNLGMALGACRSMILEAKSGLVIAIQGQLFSANSVEKRDGFFQAL